MLAFDQIGWTPHILSTANNVGPIIKKIIDKTRQEGVYWSLKYPYGRDPDYNII